ncbi:MAG TPA: hypothetical protein VGQ83_42755 [Polyangia bacterium]|jgi:hypothetical protein
MRASLPLIAALSILVPGLARGDDAAPPCRPAKPGELMLVEVDAPAPGVQRADRGSFGVRVTNHSGRVVCRVLVQVRMGARARPAACQPGGETAVGAEEMTCTFTDAGAGEPGAPGRGGRRRRGGPSSPEPASKPKLTVTGLDLAPTGAYASWQARRPAAHSQPASAPAATRFGFRHALKITRASDGKAAQRELDRAMGRLRECVLGRARRNPKLTVHATLRLGVSRARGNNGETESLLAVKVVNPPAPAPEVRDCASALDLVTVPAGTDFLATADVHYEGDGRPPAEKPEAAPVYQPSATPAQRPPAKGGHGRSGMGRRGF